MSADIRERLLADPQKRDLNTAIQAWQRRRLFLKKKGNNKTQLEIT
jgi:hypothetical protein